VDVQCEGGNCGWPAAGRCQAGCNRQLCWTHLGVQPSGDVYGRDYTAWKSDNWHIFDPTRDIPIDDLVIESMEAIQSNWRQFPQPSCNTCRAAKLSTLFPQVLREKTAAKVAAETTHQTNREIVQQRWREITAKHRAATQPVIGRVPGTFRTAKVPVWYIREVSQTSPVSGPYGTTDTETTRWYVYLTEDDCVYRSVGGDRDHPILNRHPWRISVEQFDQSPKLYDHEIYSMASAHGFLI
jgi:hypothetical protein